MINPVISAPSRPRFSVITVCFNALAILPETYASLRTQSSSDYEWIVVDGASTDGTVEWLTEIGPDVLVSERDTGIYDAMNKAIARATGDYLFFLNAGDRFADANVLTEIKSVLDLQGAPWPGIVYGDVIYFGDRGQRRKRFNWLKRSNLVFGDLCHQAAFVRREMFDRFGVFDVSLRYNADFDWFIRGFRGGARLQYVHRDVARFHDAGAHVLAAQACELERNTVRHRYCPRLLWLLGHWSLRAELKLRRMLGQEVG